MCCPTFFVSSGRDEVRATFPARKEMSVGPCYSFKTLFSDAFITPGLRAENCDGVCGCGTEDTSYCYSV